MKHHHHRGRGHRNQARCDKGAVSRMIHGLSDAFGVGHGVIIAGFVVGWVFVPLLTTLVFLGALYWMSHPDQAGRQVKQLTAWVRRAARHLSEVVIPGPGPRATEPDFAQPPDDEQPEPPPRHSRSVGELRRRFEALDRRAKSIESFVASEEFRLEREFKRIDDDLA